jgi:hypothetical protein
VDQDALRNGLLFGGYINEIAVDKLDIAPRINLKGVPRHELDAAVRALVKEELVFPWEPAAEIETGIDAGIDTAFGAGFEPELVFDLPTLPPLTITPKGKKALAGMRGSAQLGIFDRFGVVINIGSGRAELRQTNVAVTVQSFQSAVIEKIENSTVTEAEKTDAKSRLRAFIEHPLVNTILGAALGALTK